VDWDPAATTADYRAALDLEPDNDVALNNLGLELMRERQFAAAESLHRRGVALNQGQTAWVNLIWDQAGQGHYADARTTIQRFATAMPTSPATAWGPIWLAFSERDFAAVERQSQAFLIQSHIASLNQYVTSIDAAAAATQGKLALFGRQVQAADAIAEARGVQGTVLANAVWVAWEDLRYRNRPVDGLSHIAQALARHPLASLPPADRPYATLAWYYAAAGQPAEAERLLAEYARMVSACVRRASELQLRP